MRSFKNRYAIGVGCMVMGLLAGCAATPEPVAPKATDAEDKAAESTVAAPVESRAAQVADTSGDANMTAVERRFATGLEQYNGGHFANAIRIFKDPMFERAWPELKIRALKYLAFSYCVTNNLEACRGAFVELLRFSPDFALSPAERGHPIWGPVFVRAQADVQATPAR